MYSKRLHQSWKPLTRRLPAIHSDSYGWFVRVALIRQRANEFSSTLPDRSVYYQYYAPTGEYNYSTTPDGQTRYVNASGGTSITQAADAVMYANVNPKQYGGWDNNFRYKNFDLGVLLTYQLGFAFIMAPTLVCMINVSGTTPVMY